MGRIKEIALEMEDLSYGALRAMLDMGGALTPLIKQELERRDNARKDAMDRGEPESLEDHYTGA